MPENATPRETVFDVDVQRLAKVYAEAMLNAAGDHEAQGALIEELEDLETNLLARHQSLQSLFSSELISKDEKLAMVDRIFGKEASSTLLNGLRVMAHHGRLGLIRAVTQAARKVWEVRSQRVRVDLETAYPIDAQLEREIIDSLSTLLGPDPLVVKRVNPDLLTGFLLRIGDRVYDASGLSDLQRVQRQIVEHAVEELHASPGRFVQWVGPSSSTG